MFGYNLELDRLIRLMEINNDLLRELINALRKK